MQLICRELYISCWNNGIPNLSYRVDMLKVFAIFPLGLGVIAVFNQLKYVNVDWCFYCYTAN